MNKMSEKRKLFITGASGCVGHYVMDRYLQNEDVELHLLLRDPSRMRFDVLKHPSIVVHKGSMTDITDFESVVREMDGLIHIVTTWGDSIDSDIVNRQKTHELFSYCGDKCKKIVYFSTASIMGPNNCVTENAAKYGTAYIRSKYHSYIDIQKLPLKDKVVTLFPTLVFGGDETHPYSHAASGLKPNIHYMKWLRFLSVNASAHFLHAKDIAAVTEYVMENDVEKRDYVLGTPVFTGDELFQEVCEVFGYRRYFNIPVNSGFVMKLAKLLRIKMHPWDKYCIENPHMRFDAVDPSSFGLDVAFPTLRSILEDIKEG